jgi:NAD(P)-dependent dehydrogenase (short-subunit alcohol dehydrogenase family)
MNRIPTSSCRSSFMGAGFGRGHRAYPCGRCLSDAGVTGNDPQSRSVWHGAGAGRVRQCHRPRWPVSLSPHGPGIDFPPFTVEQNKASATTPVEELLGRPFLQPDQVTDSLRAYQIAKRGNSLRVMAEAVRWDKRGARVDTISPGIIMTPLAKDELRGSRGEGYRRMIEVSAFGSVGNSRRGGNCRRAPHEPGQWVHHWQRLSDGWRSDSRLLVRGSRSTMSVRPIEHAQHAMSVVGLGRVKTLRGEGRSWAK